MREALRTQLLARLVEADCMADSTRWLNTGQLARACGEDVYRTRYHLWVLLGRGLVCQVHPPRRGAVACWQYRPGGQDA